MKYLNLLSLSMLAACTPQSPVSTAAESPAPQIYEQSYTYSRSSHSPPPHYTKKELYDLELRMWYMQGDLIRLRNNLSR